MKDPILSIITVNFNNEKGLRATLNSLKTQTFTGYEHIIIDAGSTDGSLDVIKAWSKDPHNRLAQWVSEPDDGIYDGMNKGIKMAKGEYLYFLNSGDCLAEDILKDIPFDGTEYLYGDVCFTFSRRESFVWKYPDTFDTLFLADENIGWLSQQACFIHHSLFAKHVYNTDYKIISDWIHIVQCILFDGCTYRHLPYVVALYDGEGVSSNKVKTLAERRRWIKDNLPEAFARAFVELETYKRSGFSDLLPAIGRTRKFKKRVKWLVKQLYRFNSLFSKSCDDTPYVLYDHQAFEMQRFGGISRYFCEIARRLHMPYDVPVRFSINYYLTTWGVGKHVIPLPRFIFKHYKAKLIRKNWRMVTHAMHRGGNYVFHPTYYDPYFMSHIGGHPYVVTVHDMIHEKFFDLFPDAPEVTRMKKEVITNAHRIIAISENTKKDIVEILGIDPGKIDVIYHGTSMQPHSGRNRLRLPARYILYVGDRAPYKNFQRFMETFARLRRVYPDLYVVCTGRPLDKSERTPLDHLGIWDSFVHFKASDRDLAELYARAECFVYPSLYEGFGIPILEAWACRCPVVLSRASCFPEIAAEAGCYFDPLSADDMASAIASVLDDAALRARLIAAGSERLKLFSWEKAARQTEDVYRRVLAERR